MYVGTTTAAVTPEAQDAASASKQKLGCITDLAAYDYYSRICKSFSSAATFHRTLRAHALMPMFLTRWL